MAWWHHEGDVRAQRLRSKVSEPWRAIHQVVSDFGVPLQHRFLSHPCAKKNQHICFRSGGTRETIAQISILASESARLECFVSRQGYSSILLTSIRGNTTFSQTIPSPTLHSQHSFLIRTRVHAMLYVNTSYTIVHICSRALRNAACHTGTRVSYSAACLAHGCSQIAMVLAYAKNKGGNWYSVISHSAS